MTALAGQVASPTDYSTDTKRRVNRGSRVTSPPTTTTEVGVLRLDGVSVLSGHAYTIRTGTLSPVSSIANDYVGIKIRYTSDGTTATTSSTVLQTVQLRITGAGGGEEASIAVTYNPAANQTLSLLLCVSRVSGTGNITFNAGATSPMELWIDHDGVDPGDTGISL